MHGTGGVLEVPEDRRSRELLRLELLRLELLRQVLAVQAEVLRTARRGPQY